MQEKRTERKMRHAIHAWHGRSCVLTLACVSVESVGGGLSESLDGRARERARGVAMRGRRTRGRARGWVGCGGVVGG
jgi:hypothetical protein